MRLHSLGDATRVANLIRHALDGGVTTFHVSSEYESWPVFVEAWRTVGADRDLSPARIMAKVAAPHFGASVFNPEDFTRRLDIYRKALGLDRIDVAQWLLRHDLKDEPGRLDIFRRDADLIETTSASLKSRGAIGGLVSFPYTEGVARLAIAADWCDGLAMYVNPLETGLEPLLASAADKPLGVIAIRPFAAGRVFSESGLGPQEALQYAFSRPGVRSVVASASSPSHLAEAIAAVGGPFRYV